MSEPNVKDLAENEVVSIRGKRYRVTYAGRDDGWCLVPDDLSPSRTRLADDGSIACPAAGVHREP